ncbi:hypothetical protein GIB67_008461 [Kingdonia uniflora]|uniref:Polygalacturonase n=1 Tax=Kingdonia uniflora TaxID=39325 RepID=A0A7J7N5L3_9MAGN|nr:hypothetical protein GIB67_008461 [Kingdonia uniflora]
MEAPKSFLFSMLLFLISIIHKPSLANEVYNVVKLGAKSDGRTDSSKSFLDAWTAACRSTGSPTIYVPPGRYLLTHALFSGDNCKNTAITFRIDGTLIAPSDYRVIGNIKNWIKFEQVNGVSILGGILDAQGSALWACKSKGPNCPLGATSLEFGNSEHVVIQGLTSINSQMFNIVISGCQNVNIQGVKITSPGNSPNTDGIHVTSSTGVTITRTAIRTGDDCISIGPGTSNLWIEQIICGPGHGISIGSLGRDFKEAGVQNVTAQTVTFTDTENGFRIKTWAKPSNGFVRGIHFQQATMINVDNPIIIDQNYCPHEQGCPHQASGVKISDISYEDIKGTSATQVAVKFDCSKEKPCSGIVMENVNLSYRNKAARSSCSSADGSARGVVQPSSCL